MVTTVEAQHSDPEIANLFQRVLPKNELSDLVGFYKKNCVLMSKPMKIGQSVTRLLFLKVIEKIF
jgi:hypothetical protein